MRLVPALPPDVTYCTALTQDEDASRSPTTRTAYRSLAHWTHVDIGPPIGYFLPLRLWCAYGRIHQSPPLLAVFIGSDPTLWSLTHSCRSVSYLERVRRVPLARNTSANS